MKTSKITLTSIKDSDGWADIAYNLKYESYKKEHPEITDEDELSERFYKEVISKKFKYGEYADLELEIDENFNIIGGRIC